MRHWTPSIVPSGIDQNIYLVVDAFEDGERLIHETMLENADLDTVISDLLTGQYYDPVRIVSFNTAENWAQDVSEDVANEVLRRSDLAFEDVPSFLESFLNRHLSRRDVRQLALRLV